MKHIPIFPTNRPTSHLRQPNIKLFLKYLKQAHDRDYQGGHLAKQLEERLASIHGALNCVSFCNGLWGMVYGMREVYLKKGREVVMPSFTYRRLGDIVAWLGLTPHYCDVDPQTFTATVETVEPCVNKNTALILATQSMTDIVDYHSLKELADYYRVPFVVDSVEAGYGEYKGMRIGSIAQAEYFSLHASKLINGFEGGYITTHDSKQASRLIDIRDYTGINIHETHAAMTLANLDGLPTYLEHTKAVYEVYRQELESVAHITLLEYPENEVRSYKNIAVRLEHTWPYSRERTLELLHRENILARAYYPNPLHLKKAAYPTISKPLPITEQICLNHLLLPTGDFVSLEDVIGICGFFRILSDGVLL